MNLSQSYRTVKPTNPTDPTQAQSPIPPTKALYLHDETLRTLTTTVQAVYPFATLPEPDRLLFKQIPTDPTHHVVITASTIFYAQGGGQPSDTGSMNSPSPSTSSFTVLAVRNTPTGQILHLGVFTPPSTPFEPNTPVEQSINATSRDLHSRIHTAGHIVSLAVRHLATLASSSKDLVAEPSSSTQSPALNNVTELKAQHYPSTSFVDFSGTIASTHLAAIQAQCDRFVAQALPIKVYWWHEAELGARCAFVPEKVVVSADAGLVRAVDIVGAGAYPCGGTHVADTSVVGSIEVRKISRSKGVSKISYGVK